jgi:hypothetical protein
LEYEVIKDTRAMECTNGSEKVSHEKIIHVGEGFRHCFQAFKFLLAEITNKGFIIAISRQPN